ncbi:hypothetical protein CR513_53961, partial [Mucuna pruriens]
MVDEELLNEGTKEEEFHACEQQFEELMKKIVNYRGIWLSWETFKVSVTNSVLNGIVSLQMANDSVLNEEMRRKEQGSSSRYEVLLTENKGKVKKRKEKEEEKKAEKKENKGKNDFELVNLVSDEGMWIINSGVTLHVIPTNEFFTSYTLGDFGVLKMGNDSVFKGEALYIAMHVINLSPIVALNIEVPDKIWFGKDVKYDHLQVFGCKAFVHVSKDERSKLDMKTRQCIFIGYCQDVTPFYPKYLN